MGNEFSTDSLLLREAAKASLVNTCDAVKMAVREVARAERIDSDADVLQVAREVTKMCKEVAENTAAEIIKETRARNARRLMQANAHSTTPQRVPRAQNLPPELLFLELMRVALSDATEPRGASGSSERSGSLETQAIAHPWRRQEELGRGSFGLDYAAVDKNGLKFAVKEIPKDKVEEPTLRAQVKSLGNLSHRNLVRCYGCAGDREKFYMYTELMQGSVRGVMDKYGKPIPEITARKYTKDILQGLIYLHVKDVIHQNIKCGNVLLDTSGLAKLGDMVISKKGATADTLPWMSPEVLSGQVGGKRSDVWSLGCTVFEMLKGKPPFMKDLPPVLSAMVLPRMILGLQHKNLVNDDGEFGPSLKNFLSRIFVKMDDRQSAQQVANHPWVR